MSANTRRAREVTGPGVGAVAIMARHPANMPSDFLILQRRQQEENLRGRAQAADELKFFDIKVSYDLSVLTAS